MIRVDILDKPPRDDENYREQWSAFYAMRRRYLVRLLRLACGAGVFALLIALVTDSFQLRHLVLMNVVAALGAIVLLAAGFQWFALNWAIGSWPCPRCGEDFFASTFVRNPFGMRCRHCKLLRLKKSEVAMG
jgi:hypothetical protein